MSELREAAQKLVESWEQTASSDFGFASAKAECASDLRAALVAHPSSQPADLADAVDALLGDLDDIARAFDSYAYGLPLPQDGEVTDELRLRVHAFVGEIQHYPPPESPALSPEEREWLENVAGLAKENCDPDCYDCRNAEHARSLLDKLAPAKEEK